MLATEGLMASRQGALALLFPGPLKQQLSWGVCSNLSHRDVNPNPTSTQRSKVYNPNAQLLNPTTLALSAYTLNSRH